MNAPETTKSTENSTRPKAINAGMTGLTGITGSLTTDRLWAFCRTFQTLNAIGDKHQSRMTPAGLGSASRTPAPLVPVNGAGCSLQDQLAGINPLGKYDEVIAVPTSARNNHSGKSEKECCVCNLLRSPVLTKMVSVQVDAQFCQCRKSGQASNALQIRLYLIRQPFWL